MAQREAVHLAGLAGKMERRYTSKRLGWSQLARAAAKRAERAEQAQAKALELGLPSSAQGYELTYNDLGTSYKYVMHNKTHKKAQRKSYRAYVRGIVKKGVQGVPFYGKFRASAVEAAVDVAAYLKSV